MSEQEFSDETLMAFADGELDEITAARVAEAARLDAAVQARIAVFAQSRRAVHRAIAPLADTPVPPALAARVRERAAAGPSPASSPDTAAAVGTAAADGGARPTSRPTATVGRRLARRAWPLAASLALLLGAAGGYVVGAQTAAGPTPTGFAVVTGPTWAEALSTAASGDEVPLDTEAPVLRAGGSFREADGTLCREFEIADTAVPFSGIACHADGAWRPTLLVRAAGDGYAPAAGEPILDAYADAAGAGPFLDAGAEAEALAATR